jgi:hypothetical protein
MIAELLGTHLLISLDFTNFKTKETGVLAKTILEKIEILSKVTGYPTDFLVDTINNNSSVPNDLIKKMQKATLKVPTLEKIKIPPKPSVSFGGKGKSFVNASLDVMTKDELKK